MQDFGWFCKLDTTLIAPIGFHFSCSFDGEHIRSSLEHLCSSIYVLRNHDVYFSSFFYNQENQVMALKEKGIAAEFLSSTQTSQVRNKVIQWILTRLWS